MTTSLRQRTNWVTAGQSGYYTHCAYTAVYEAPLLSRAVVIEVSILDTHHWYSIGTLLIEVKNAPSCMTSLSLWSALRTIWTCYVTNAWRSVWTKKNSLKLSKTPIQWSSFPWNDSIKPMKLRIRGWTRSKTRFSLRQSLIDMKTHEVKILNQPYFLKNLCPLNYVSFMNCKGLKFFKVFW